MLVDVVGGSVVVVVLVVVVGATVVVAAVVAEAWAVPSSSVPAHDVSSNVAATTIDAAAPGARRAHVSQDPPFPRANICTIMSLNHRPIPSIA